MEISLAAIWLLVNRTMWKVVPFLQLLKLDPLLTIATTSFDFN